MTITRISKNHEAATMEVTAQFDVPREQVWRLWDDPRLLERWWGPPSYPATVVGHDLSAGGSITYFMTGPEGDRHHGLWKVREVEAPQRIVFDDAFADDAGNENTELPLTCTEVTITERIGGGTTMVMVSNFPSPEAMTQMEAMGMEEGLREAMGQMDARLAGAA